MAFIVFLSAVFIAFKFVILPIKRKAKSVTATIKEKKNSGSYQSPIAKVKNKAKAKRDAVIFADEAVRERARLAVQKEHDNKQD